jgi:hypothetical protein
VKFFYGSEDSCYVLLGYGDTAVSEERATLPTWLIETLKMEGSIYLRDIRNHEPDYSTVL